MSIDAHCWHPSGVALSTLMTMSNIVTERVMCCYCGLQTDRRWKDESGPIPGHGPYAKRETRVLLVDDSYFADCPKRPVTGTPRTSSEDAP